MAAIRTITCHVRRLFDVVARLIRSPVITSPSDDACARQRSVTTLASLFARAPQATWCICPTRSRASLPISAVAIPVLRCGEDHVDPVVGSVGRGGGEAARPSVGEDPVRADRVSQGV